jgi:hypothetical protein
MEMVNDNGIPRHYAVSIPWNPCRFEPWWIARRADIIPYDVRYRGYGKNKLQHLHELVNDLGFR